jgi:serine/threonine-protein kinase
MVYVPAGEFWMGSEDSDPDAYDYEKPRHKVYVDAFWIDKTEVTNAQYKRCVDAGVCSPPGESISYTRDKYYGNPDFDDYPVIYVTWRQAQQYAAWVGGRLPTEAEWEYAAMGPNGYIYPWGSNPPDDSLANYNGRVGDTTAAGSYPDGASRFGALDMAGNVWEWMSSLYKDYPYDATDGREDLDAEGDRVLRGGAFLNESRDVRCTHRTGAQPDGGDWDNGFRVVVAPS